MTADSTQQEMPACPGCGSLPESSLACLECGRLLEEPPGANHLTRLGLDPAEALDPKIVETRYLRLSRLLHPDFQSGADAATRDRALAHSALLNEAVKVLKDEQLRHEYLLELHHPGSLEKHKTLDPAFLMEAMELSEELEEAHGTGCQATVHRIADLARGQIEERMSHVTKACSETMQRIAAASPDHAADPSRSGLPSSPLTAWDTEEIATLLHEARVYRRILRDTGRKT